MSINQFTSLFEPGTIKFYQDEGGFLTCDSLYHELLYKKFIIVNEERFAKIIGRNTLYNLLSQIRPGSKLKFDSNGNLYNPPTEIKYLLNAEKRYNFIEALTKEREIVLTIGVYLACIIAVLVAVRKLTFSDRVGRALETEFELMVLSPAH